MDKETVVKIISLYNDIPDKIKYFEDIINSYTDEYYNPLGAAITDRIGHSDGAIADMTGKIAVALATSSISKEMKDLREEIQALQKVHFEITKAINWLPARERNIVIMFYIKKIKWLDIAEQMHYSRKQCRNIRNAAINHLQLILEKNKTITGYIDANNEAIFLG